MRVVLCRFLVTLPTYPYRAAHWLEPRIDAFSNFMITLLGVPWGEVSGDIIELQRMVGRRRGEEVARA